MAVALSFAACPVSLTTTPSVATSRSYPLHVSPVLFFAFRSTSKYRYREPLRASRRFPNYRRQDSVEVVPDQRGWRQIHSLADEQDYDTEDEGDEEEEDRSLDLLVRFLGTLFRKVSRRARRAVRSVLPVPIPARLVGFSVNGVLIIAFLWILKALLEVVCTIGSMVFVSILVVRGMWFGILYLQENRFNPLNRYGDDDDAWSGVQPAT